MASSGAELVIRLLADTSSATQAFDNAGASIMKMLGAGGGVGAAGFAAIQASARMQDAMATVEQAYNSVDFTQGSAKYTAAKDSILKDSATLATSFKDVTDVYSQGARFVDDFGNKLDSRKVDEYTQTMIRLSKVSTDALSPTDIGSRVDVIAKLFGSTDFAGIGAMVSAESGIHNQGEGPMLATTTAIAQYGAPLGVTMAQAMGIGNYLTDLGGGGQTGGASFGRMLLRMGTSADQVLDPEATYSDEKKQRSAQEKLDDLQSSLAVAQQRESQMYGQHGLRTSVQRDPAALMASQNQIAKLQRDIADQQADMTHENDAKTRRGQMNVVEMARTAGMDSTDYAELVKTNPAEALMSFTRGLHDLPATERGAAETRAGITNVRDIKTADLLAFRPDVLASQIGVAQTQQDNPVDLIDRAAKKLDDTLSAEANFVNTLRNGEAVLGEAGRPALDAGLKAITEGVQANGFGPLEAMLKTVTDKFDMLDTSLSTLGPVFTVLGPALGYALPGILKNVLAGGGSAATGAGVGTTGTSAADVAVGAGGAGALSSAASVALIASAPALMVGEVMAFKQSLVTMHGEAHDLMLGLSDMNQMRVEGALKNHGYSEVPDAPGLLRQIMNELQIAQPPTTVHVGPINAGSSLEQVLSAVTAQITVAWNAATSSTPVSGSMGGNLGAPSPAH